MTTRFTALTHPQFGEVRTVAIKGESWFVAKDICDILGLINSRKALSSLDVDEKGVTISDTLGGKQEMATVNESGLYSLIFQSRKPEAKIFRKWVTSEVLPAIRRQGFYVHPSAKLSLSEIRRLEKLMLQNVRKYIRNEDIYKCHKKLRVHELDVSRVINGTSINSAIMADLQERAVENQQRWSDAYSPERMQEVIKSLTTK